MALFRLAGVVDSAGKLFKAAVVTPGNFRRYKRDFGVFGCDETGAASLVTALGLSVAGFVAQEETTKSAARIVRMRLERTINIPPAEPRLCCQFD